jgi:hypothetical protein
MMKTCNYSFSPDGFMVPACSSVKNLLSLLWDPEGGWLSAIGPGLRNPGFFFAGSVKNPFRMHHGAVRGLLLIVIMMTAPCSSTFADNYEMRGRMSIDNQQMPFYFRWDDGRWMLCEVGDPYRPQYEQSCVSSDGTNLVFFCKNKPNPSQPALVPYQAEVKLGSFPGRDVRFFGAVAAALDKRLLDADLNGRACRVVYPATMPDLCEHCATNYKISLTEPSALRTVISVVTDDVAGTPYGLKNGWEILHAEITNNASNPELADQFDIRFQNPKTGASGPEDVVIVSEISGTVTEFKSLTEHFDGWPHIEGKTAVTDHRVESGTNQFTMTYLTVGPWVKDLDATNASAVQGQLLGSVEQYNGRPKTSRWVLLIFCASASAFGVLLANRLAKKKPKP